MLVHRHREKGALLGFAIWNLVLVPLALIGNPWLLLGWLFNLPALALCMVLGIIAMQKVQPAVPTDWDYVIEQQGERIKDARR